MVGLSIGVLAQPDADEEARRAQVVARVDETSLTVGSIEDDLHSQTPFQRTRFTRRARLQEYVESLVRFELLAAEAERRGFGEHPNVIKILEQSSVQGLLRREFDERVAPETIPAEAVAAYYREHPEQFARPELRRAHHILVADDEAARALLEELQEADLRQFRETARARSLDTETKLRGGDLRYFARDGRPAGARRVSASSDAEGELEPADEDDPPVDAPLAEAAFGIEAVGDLAAEPVAVGDHFSVVMLSGLREAENRSLEEAEESIRLRLFRERRQAAIDAFVQSLRERYRPEVHPERLDPIRLAEVEVETSRPRPTKGPGDH